MSSEVRRPAPMLRRTRAGGQALSNVLRILVPGISARKLPNVNLSHTETNMKGQPKARRRLCLAMEQLEERTVPSLFGPPANTQVGPFPEGIASGDLDGGKPDLVVSNQNGNSVSVLLN